MVTLLAVAVIVVAAVYGLRIANDSSEHDTHHTVCVAITCTVNSPKAEGTEMLRMPDYPRDRPEEY